DIGLTAGTGKVKIESQRNELSLIAQQVLNIISTMDAINLTAKKEIVLHAGRTRIVINDQGYFVYTDGNHLVHAGSHATEGPQAMPLTFPQRTFSNPC
ncbi:DUF2345 domain-containing protein, partial [Paraburkholderia sp. SIMBA_027]